MNKSGNIEHRMVGCPALDWMLSVGCWMLDVESFSAEARHE